MSSGCGRPGRQRKRGRGPRGRIIGNSTSVGSVHNPEIVQILTEEEVDERQSCCSPATSSPLLTLSPLINEINRPEGASPSPSTGSGSGTTPFKRQSTKRSEWWSHYSKETAEDGTSIRKCKYCPTTYIDHGGTGNMYYHIQICHPEKITAPKEVKLEKYFEKATKPVVS